MDNNAFSRLLGVLGAQQANPVNPQITPPDMVEQGADNALMGSPEMSLAEKVQAYNAINPNPLPVPMGGHPMFPARPTGGSSLPSLPQMPPMNVTAAPTAAPTPMPMRPQGFAAPSPAAAPFGQITHPDDKYPIRKGAGLGNNLMAWLMNKSLAMTKGH